MYLIEWHRTTAGNYRELFAGRREVVLLDVVHPTQRILAATPSAVLLWQLDHQWSRILWEVSEGRVIATTSGVGERHDAGTRCCKDQEEACHEPLCDN